MTNPTNDGVAALREGRAFVDLKAWRKVQVGGADAAGWLNDLLSAELSDLSAGEARRSLLLSPTGRIRADVHVLRTDQGFLLLQDPIQPTPIDTLLEPYVLSSDVELSDRTADLAVFAFPGHDPPGIAEVRVYRPSVLGAGADLVGPVGRATEVRSRAGLQEADADAVEAWRIERGAARFGVDLGTESLPQEGGLDDAIAYGKGCFLGQEAMAKVRNLGHPPFLLLSARSDGPVKPGDAVLSDGTEAGRVTSATMMGTRTALIARVRWNSRESELRSASGQPLRILGLASGAG